MNNFFHYSTVILLVCHLAGPGKITGVCFTNNLEWLMASQNCIISEICRWCITFINWIFKRWINLLFVITKLNTIFFNVFDTQNPYFLMKVRCKFFKFNDWRLILQGEIWARLSGVKLMPLTGMKGLITGKTWEEVEPNIMQIE